MKEKLPNKNKFDWIIGYKHIVMRILIKNNVFLLNHVYTVDLHRSYKSYKISYDVILYYDTNIIYYIILYCNQSYYMIMQHIILYNMVCYVITL